MKSDNFLVRFLVNSAVGVLFGALLIGTVAFLLAGSEGVINGVIIGAFLGLFGSFASIGALENTAWFTGVFSRYGQKRHANDPEE